MTSLSSFDLRQRAGAEEFSRFLDGSTRTKKASTAALSCAGLAAGLRTAGASLHPLIAPGVDFRSALRARLMAVAAVAPATDVSARPLTAWRPGPRLGGVVAGAMASVVAVSGVAVAAGQSLPGDPFYGVKRTTETWQLRTSDGDLNKGTRYLDLAAIRLREVRGLTLGRDAARGGPPLGPSALGLTASDPLERGFAPALRQSTTPLAGPVDVADGAVLSAAVAQRVAETLSDMDMETQRGSALLTMVFRDNQAPLTLQSLARFATRQSESLVALLPALPVATQTRARVSLALVTAVADNTEQLLAAPRCGPACDPTSVAPTVPPVLAPSSNPLQLTPQATPTTTPTAPCDCANDPEPAPQASSDASATPQFSAEPSSEPAPADPGPRPEPEPSDSPSASPKPPPSPAPSPSPTGGPLPIPLTVPLPIPLPTPIAQRASVSTPIALPRPSTLPVPRPMPQPMPQPIAHSIPQPALVATGPEAGSTLTGPVSAGPAPRRVPGKKAVPALTPVPPST